MKQFAILSGVTLAVIFGAASISNAQGCYEKNPTTGKCEYHRRAFTGYKDENCLQRPCRPPQYAPSRRVPQTNK
jgi:hypothetical protein